MEKLKVCPFCKHGDKLQIDFDLTLPNELWIANVSCRICGTKGAEAHWFNSLEAAKKEAARLWNTRTSGWISVEDRLPAITEVVMVWNANWEFPDFGSREFIYDGNGAFFWCDTKGEMLSENDDDCMPTHWMPMPAAPEGEVMKELKLFEVSVPVSGFYGNQIFAVNAENSDDAIRKVKNGKGKLVETEYEITDLDFDHAEIYQEGPEPKCRNLTESSWISVEDRLPEITKSALVAIDSGGIQNIQDVAYIDLDGKWSIPSTVTHWMPLPAAPEA